MCGLIFAASQANSEICNSDIGKNSRNLHCGAIAKMVLAKFQGSFEEKIQIFAALTPTTDFAKSETGVVFFSFFFTFTLTTDRVKIWNIFVFSTNRTYRSTKIQFLI